MRQVIVILFLGSLFFSCKKDKVPEPCTNVELTGKRASVVGTWRWYTTRVYQTFTSGTFPLDYTPVTEGFNYYCVITADGKYKGYKDSVLVDEFSMTSIFYDNNNTIGVYRLAALRNCGEEQLDMTVFSSDSTEDVLALREFPIYIKEPDKYSTHNRFKRD